MNPDNSPNVVDLAKHFKQTKLHDDRAALLQQITFSVLGFAVPENVLDILNDALVIERNMGGLVDEPEAENQRQAILETVEAYIRACREILLPVIEKHADVFMAPTPEPNDNRENPAK